MADNDDFGLPPGFELEDEPFATNSTNQTSSSSPAPVTPAALEDDEGSDIDQMAFDEEAEELAGGAMPAATPVPGTTAKVPMPPPMKLGGPPPVPGAPIDPSLDPFKFAPTAPSSGPNPSSGTPAAARPVRGPRFTADVEDAIARSASEYGVDENLLRTFAKIESGGDPAKRTGSYKGVMMLSDKEFARFGGKGNIFDPRENVRVAAVKFKAEATDFQRKYGRPPSPEELYMVHQQGAGGFDAHLRNPDRPAWESMYSTAEGRQKGPGWARQAIWGNVPDDVKKRYGSVDNMTSRDFLELWRGKYARLSGGAGSRPVQVAQAGGALPEFSPIQELPPGFQLEQPASPAGLPPGFEVQPVAGALPPGFEIEPVDGKNRDSVIGGLTDPQQYKEFAKGVVPGGISAAGTALQGPDTLVAGGQRNAAAGGAKMLEVIRRIDAGETVHPSEDVLGYQEMDPTTRTNIRTDLERAQAAFNPTNIQDRSLYKAGEAVKEYAKGLFPAAPGYETAVGRQLGEGLGSMGVSLPAAAFLGPLGGAAVLGSMGMGEATSRAVEFDKKERSAGRPGLTQEQITTAGLLGIGPGATDLVPIEILLGRLPLPIPAAAKGPLAKAIARIGGQAFVEGMQEGGQQFLQNLIAREVYNPGQTLGEDVLGNMGIGAGVGGIAQGGKEVAGGLFGRRRGRGAQPAQEEQQPPPADPQAQPETQDATPAGAQPAAPGTPLTPPQGGAQLPELAGVPWEERSLLTKGGYSPDMIADMEPEERASIVADFRAQGLTPDPEPARAPDAPSAEPIGDLVAQARDLTDPANPRKGLYLSIDNIAALEADEAKTNAFAKEIQGPVDVIENVDGKGGILFAQDAATGAEVREALAGGADFQTVIGTLTGAGTGKPADGSIAVQQVDRDGNVTRESLVRPEDVVATKAAFAAPDREVRTLTAEDAIARREEGTRSAPVRPQSPDDLVRAGGIVAEPTEAQKKAGNYQKLHTKFQGLDISIENPKGSTRSGKSPDGASWSVEMPAHYGYVKRTEGADGDQVDVYLGDNLESDRAFVVDQVDADSGQFDEHKAMLGFDSRAQAIEAYNAAFSDGAGPDRIGTVREMSVGEFKDWLKTGNTTEPAAPDTKRRRPRRYNETGNSLSFIRGKGGIQPDADLLQIADGVRLPGLFNQRGVAPDRMREALVEAGFLRDTGGDGVTQSSIDDLYDLVDRIVRGESVGQGGQTIEKPVSRKTFEAESRRQIIADTEELLAENGIPYELSSADEDRLVALVMDEYMGISDALERMALEVYDETSGRTEGEGEDLAGGFLEDVQPEREEAPGDVQSDPEQVGDGLEADTEQVEAPAEVENDRGPSEELTDDEIEMLVEGWRMVKEVDTQIRAGKELSDEQIAEANERDADLYDYGISIDDHKTEEAVRQHLGRPVQGAPEGSQQPEGPEAAEGQGSEDGGREGPERGERETEAVEPKPDEAPARAERSPDQLRDYTGVQIDGYASQTVGNEEKDGAVKTAFLADARNYLTKVAKELAGRGFAPYEDRKGKPGKPVNVNPGGIAVSGDVSLSMIDAEGRGIYAMIGTALAGPKGGISLMARTMTADRQSGNNNWWSVDLTAKELADKLELLARGSVTEPDKKPDSGAAVSAKAPDSEAASEPDTQPAPAAAPDLSKIFLNLNVEVTDGDEEVTVRMSAADALDASNKRIKSLHTLLECLAR